MAGRLIEEIDALGRIPTSGYDAVGRQVFDWSPRNILVTTSYDSAGRTTGRAYPSGRLDTFSYDAANRQTVVADSVGMATNVYDQRGNIVEVANVFGKTLTYTFDPAGRRQSMQGGSGITTYAYDAAGQQTVLVDPRNRATTFSYNEEGRCLNKQTLTLNVTHTYDEAGWLAKIENYKQAGTAQSIFTYTYDSIGNRTSQEAMSGVIATWTYDKTYQLTAETRGGSAEIDLAYHYDGAGNRLLEVDNLASETTTSTYGAANQLDSQEATAGTTTYTYDADGNRIKKETSSALTEYQWDEAGMMSVAQPPEGDTNFKYTALGQRVEKETPTEVRQFLYDFQRLAEEHEPTGDPLREYSFGPDNTSGGWGDLVSEYDFAEDENHDHTYDAQWSTDALLDDGGSEAATYKYRAFGLVENKSGTDDTAMSFVGKQGYYSDTELDLYYLGASTNSKGGGRPYDPATGVFLARDPLKYDAGDENLYRYVGNNPVNQIDPSGQDYLNVIGNPNSYGEEQVVLQINRPECTKHRVYVGRKSTDGKVLKVSNHGCKQGMIDKRCNCILPWSSVEKAARDFPFTQLGPSQRICKLEKHDHTRNAVHSWLEEMCGGHAINEFQPFKDPCAEGRKAFNKQIESYATPVCTVIEAAVDRDACGIVESLGNCKALADKFSDLPSLFSKIVGNAEQMFMVFMEGAGNALDTLQQPMELLNFFVQGLIDFLGVGDVVDSFSDVFTALFQGEQDPKQGGGPNLFQSILTAVFEFFYLTPENLIDTIASAAGIPASLLLGVYDVVSEFIVSGLGAGVTKAKQLLGGVVDQIFNTFVSDLPNLFSSLTQQLIGQIVTALVAKIAKFAAKAISGPVLPIAQLGLDLLEQVGKYCGKVVDFIDFISKAVDSAIEDPRGAAATVKKLVLDAFKSAVDSAIQFVANWLSIGDLPQKIADTRNLVQDALYNAVSALVKPLKSQLSRLFGNNLPPGAKPVETPGDLGEDHVVWYDVEKKTVMMASSKPESATERIGSAMKSETNKERKECLEEALKLLQPLNDAGKALNQARITWNKSNKKPKEATVNKTAQKSSTKQPSPSPQQTAVKTASETFIKAQNALVDKLKECGHPDLVDSCVGVRYQALPPAGGSWLDYVKNTCKGRVIPQKTGTPSHGHHIVLKKRYAASAESRKILCKYGINPYVGCENLVVARNWCHSKAYAEHTLKLLKSADQRGRKGDIIKALDQAADDFGECDFKQPAAEKLIKTNADDTVVTTEAS